MRLERIGPQLLEEIAFSGKPLKQIAAERKLSIEAVQRTSSLYGLRSRARTLSILSKVLSRAASERSAVQRKAMVPRKFFSVEEKTRLLKEHRFGILGVAKGYWAFQRTKEHLGHLMLS